MIDTTGRIVIPGFVDTHRHTWEAAGQVEMQMGHGWPPTGKCFAHGLRPS